MDYSAQLRITIARQEQEIKQLRQGLKQANNSIEQYQASLADLKKEIPHLQTFLSLSNDIFFVLNAAGLVRQVSISLTHQLGYSLREVNGHNLGEIVHPGDRALLEETLHKSSVRPGESLPAVEIRFKRKDGAWRYFEIVATNLLDERQRSGIVLCAMDVTERKQLAEKLALTRQFMLDFDEELLSLTLESVVWETAIERLEASFEGTRVYFAESGGDDDEADAEEQLVLHPPEVHQAFFSGNGYSPALNTLSTLLIEAAEMSQPLSPGDAPVSSRLVGSFCPAVTPSGEAVAHSMLLVPLFKNDRLVVGMVVETAGGGGDGWSDDDLALFQTVLQRLWLSVQNVRLYRRGQVGAVLEERLRMARNLHDSIQQNLYGIELHLNTALTLLGSEKSQSRHPLQIALDYSRNSMTELHSLLYDLRPESLQTQGLVVGLESQLALVLNNGLIEVKNNLGNEPEVSLEIKEALYWVGREALHNVVKHSQATRLELRLDQPESEEFIQLTVTDNGRGFDPDGFFPGHLGLQSMRERVSRLGGTISIESAPGQRTMVRVSFPLTA